MDVNYNTDKLVIINYPIGAGGKFISLCLALSPQFAHQHIDYARKKINGELTPYYFFQFSESIIDKNSSDHYELGCCEFAGFNSDFDLEKQDETANDIWRELTNQSEVYFCMAGHTDDKGWYHYPRAKHIVLKYYDWILSARNYEIFIQKGIEHENKIKKSVDPERQIEFDQSSIISSIKFYEEISKMFDWLDIEHPKPERIEKLRKLWLNSFQIGFKQND